MDTFTLVRTGHLNHQGNLFGGQLLKWVDEYAWFAATRDYCVGTGYPGNEQQRVHMRYRTVQYSGFTWSGYMKEEPRSDIRLMFTPKDRDILMKY